VEAITAHPIVEALLDRHHDALGDHMSTYRNHVYRCISYHQMLLGAPLPDFAALAWATHDLGIWTAHSFDYLQASADLAGKHAEEFGIKQVDQVKTLITEHHRLRPVQDQLTETFRKADLVDVSHGLLSSKVRRTGVRAVVAQLPYLGFHAFLVKGLSQHAVRHPRRPLPMLRW
jgi:hypothetical protein